MAVNPNLDEALLVQALASLFDLVDHPQQIDLATFHYPAPDQAHPAGRQVQRRKINQALAAISGQAKLHPIVHGYGPLDDFCDRLKLVLDSPTSGLWINRYAFLSDAKLGAIKELLASIEANLQRAWEFYRQGQLRPAVKLANQVEIAAGDRSFEVDQRAHLARPGASFCPLELVAAALGA